MTGGMTSMKKIILLLTMISQSTAILSRKEMDVIGKGLSAGNQITDFLAGMGDPKKQQIFNTLGKMTQYLGAAGAFVSLALLFIPEQDSAELAYMKTQFVLVNTKLDKITTELDKIQALITYENQRAAYLSSAHAIIHGHDKLMRLLDELVKVKCKKANCQRIRTRIAERYVASLDVEKHLYKILRGTTGRTSVFGDPLLFLVKKAYQCDIARINRFTNGVLKLAFKAQQVILAHEKFKGSKHSIAQSMNDWLVGVYSLRDASYKIKQICFSNIRAQIIKDIRKGDYQANSATNYIANTKVKRFLEAKYPWLDVVAFSYSAYGGSEHCTKDVYGAFWSMPSGTEARKRNLIVSFPDKKGTFTAAQRESVKNAMRDIERNVNFIKEKRDSCKVMDKIEIELKKRNVWKFVISLNVRTKTEGFAMSGQTDRKVIENTYTFSINYRASGGRGKSRRPTEKFQAHVVIVLKSMELVNNRKCTLSCKNGGICKQYPLSSQLYCHCKSYFQGPRCEEHSEALLAKTIDAMVATTIRIPVMSDVYFDIKDLRQFVGISFGNMQRGISNLEASIERKFEDLSKHISSSFKWMSFVTQYREAIQDIRYFAHRFESLPSEFRDKESLQIEGKILAKEVLHISRGIRKPLYNFNKLLVGNVGQPLLHHQPVLLAFMEKQSISKEPCGQPYKQAVDNYWRRLILLQQLGFMVWSQALAFLGRNTDFVNSLYKSRLAKQTDVIRKGTCNYTIDNSENINCQGHYLHPGMTIKNRCKDRYYIKGSNETSCRKKTSSCKRCDCYEVKSNNTLCASNGTCYCKQPFFGANCTDRDCVYGEWSKFEPCSCGYDRSQVRVRKPKMRAVGKGYRCADAFLDFKPCFVGCCKDEFRCNHTKKCIPSKLKCNYDNDCGDGQDESECRESCVTKYTHLNSYRRLTYLTSHRLGCGFGSVLKGFGLQRIGNRVRYRYVCCKLSKNICENYGRYSHFTSVSSRSNAKLLAQHMVHCHHSGLVSHLQLAKNNYGNSIRYFYHCCYLRHLRHRKRVNCYSRHTGWTKDGHGGVVYLDRQYVGCKDRYFLSKFQLNHKPNSWWGQGHFRYYYRCCKIAV